MRELDIRKLKCSQAETFKRTKEKKIKNNTHVLKREKQRIYYQSIKKEISMRLYSEILPKKN